jgi:hypothetical protein
VIPHASVLIPHIRDSMSCHLTTGEQNSYTSSLTARHDPGVLSVYLDVCKPLDSGGVRPLCLVGSR